jgi:glyoxylase-like metal-dependent hydrolase (beta-lactamase superfamily II)
MPEEQSGRRTRHKLVLVVLTLSIMGLALLGYRLFTAEEFPNEKSRRPPISDGLQTNVPSKLAPGIYLLGVSFPAAVYAVETSEGLVLIDSGIEPDARRVIQQLKVLGLDWRRLRAILLTHVHGDHSGGARYLREATGAKIYAGSGDARTLRSGGPREAFFSWLDRPEHRVLPTPVDVELQGDTSFEIGDVRFQALAAPGHTPGGICYLMEHGGLRALFAGDVIMCLRGNPEIALRMSKPLGTYIAYLPPRYSGSPNAFLTTLRRLKDLPVPDLVLPGHPRLDFPPQSPRLSQRSWESLLDAGIHEMETLLARQKRDGMLFLDGAAKQLLPDLFYLGNFDRKAVYGFVAGSRLFLVGAPSKPGFMEFVNRQLSVVGLKPKTPTALLLTSADKDEIGGLKELIETTRAEVVVSQDGMQKVLKACPAGTKLLTPDALVNKGWFSVTVIPLRGRGTGPVAYELTWARKTILFSGRIPVPLKVEFIDELISDVWDGNGNIGSYLVSLERLRDVRPDLWLPNIPWECQNANLYDSEWKEIIQTNLSFQNRTVINSLPP